MPTQLSPFWPHLLTTLQHRPYVFAFLVCFLVFATLQFGWKRMLLFLGLGWVIAFASEVSSIRNGFPYGDYQYVYENLKGELLLWGVPLWDSLSYTFLAYASYSTGQLITFSLWGEGRGEGKSKTNWKVIFLMVLLMTGIDVVIDPLTALGDQWFLGRIYYYPHGGIYFGVPLSNFFGWALVALAIGFAFQKIDPWIRQTLPPWKGLRAYLGVLLYLGVYLFNWSITLWLGLWKLALADLILVSPLLYFLYSRRKSTVSESIR